MIITPSQKIPSVSVIIPNFNYARFLPARIDSVLRQTFQDFELILLDDASTDDSATVLSAYSHHPLVTHVVFNEKNSGSPFPQWMKGIRLARGRYVWIAEADDLAETTFLETCVALCEAGKNVSFCFAGSKIVTETDAVSEKDINHWKHSGGLRAACFDGPQYARHNLYWKNYVINASAVLFSREAALRLAQSPFLAMRSCGDYLFWFEMAMQGKVIEVYETLNRFRQHAGKVTNRQAAAGRGIEEDIRVLQLMEERLGELPAYSKRLRRGMLWRKIDRSPATSECKRQLQALLCRELGSDKADYRLERRNQWLRLLRPGLPTRRRERLDPRRDALTVFPE